MIRCTTVESVTTVLIDRPECRNALSLEMIRELGKAIVAADALDTCRCLVLKGAGGNFCAGRELVTGIDRSLGQALEYDEAYCAIFRALCGLTKPSVAVVQGYAVAGGFTLAMGCDFVIADETARFGALEMRNGFPAALNTVLLSHLIGRRQALEFLLSGDVFPARHLLEVGLINRLACDEMELIRIERDFVGRLSALDPLAVRLTKEMHRAAANMPLADALAMGKQLNALLLASGRIEEAAQAFAARQRERD